jgi:hypothetical protein
MSGLAAREIHDAGKVLPGGGGRVEERAELHVRKNERSFVAGK